MRLTLRTLLAYLDDILEPSQAKEIGKKVAESNVASTLVNRIKEVTRRRRLTAPEVSGPGSGVDANLVAEYLDNTLPAERVADIEKVCLDSDTHLAEVAACHQILALVLGEPVEIQSQSRERMYALVPSENTRSPVRRDGRRDDDDSEHEAARDAVRYLSGAASATSASEPEVRSAPVPAKEPDERIPGIPADRPFWSMSLPYVIVAGVILVWFGLFMLDPALRDSILGTQSDRGTPVAATNVAPVAGDDDLDALLDSETGPPQQDGTVAAVIPDVDDHTDLEDAATDDDSPTVDGEMDDEQLADLDETSSDAGPALTPEDEAEMNEATAVAKDADATESREVAAVDTAKPPPAGTIEKPKPSEPPSVPGPDLDYSSKEGVLLRYDTDEAQWFMLPHRSIVHSGEELASPAPFRAWLDVLDKTCRVTMLEETRMTVMYPTEAALCGFDVKEGRLLFEANQPQVVLSLVIDGHLWRLELLSGDAVCGVEVIEPLPNHFEEDVSQMPPKSRLIVHRGTVRLADGANQIYVMETHDSLMLTGIVPVEAAQPGVIALPLTDVPDWINPDNNKMTTIARRHAISFEKEFALDQPVALTIPPVMRYDDPRQAEFAAMCLGLLGNGKELVHALSIVSASHPEVRVAVMNGIKKWMVNHPEEIAQLQASLQKHFPRDAETVYRLLWGYNAEDLSDGATSQQLVNWLGHENLIVRELAFFYIRTLTGRTNEYRPNAPANQRTLSANRWQMQLDRDGALLNRP